MISINKPNFAELLNIFVVLTQLTLIAHRTAIPSLSDLGLSNTISTVSHQLIFPQKNEIKFWKAVH